MTLDAILLAGGRATRVDGAAKPLFEVGGRTLLQGAVDAVRDAGAQRIVAVGPDVDPTLHWVREDPLFGGPVAATVTALDHVEADWTILLACDLPAAGPAIRMLVDALPLLPRDADGVCLGDPSSRPQWLIGLYRTAALREAASALPDGGRDAAVRDLVADLAVTVLAAPAELTHDIDTWEDLTMSRTLPPEALDAWAAALAEHFDLSPDDIPVALVLDLARDVANDVARPAAPFSAFVAGLVAGRTGASPEVAVAEITALAREWKA